MSEVVKVDLIPTACNRHIGHVTLNKPKALNALGADMAELLLPQLLKWQEDKDIVAVVLDGEGEKAFCAGGDVVAMHKAMQQNPEQVPAGLQAFFELEYTLDHLIHTYPKPLLVWGTGIVMGGGMGLMNGASHRVVTETSRIAMPEISIGLYPDVGGSYFLNQMPQGCGLFLGLTGASINASDALYLNLADHFMASKFLPALLDTMSETRWADNSAEHHQQLTDVCNGFTGLSEQHKPADNIKAHQQAITEATSLNDVTEVVAAILKLEAGDDKWLSKAQKTLAHGSPVSMHLVWQQLARGKGMSLADVFRMELIMSCRCGAFGEFQEGVRALLIDKDNQPDWAYKSVNDVPADVVEQFFTSLWPEGQHPLANLGE